MNRHVGTAVALVGVCVSVSGFLLLGGASLPYPDPTPEMLSAQAREIRLHELQLAVGLVLFVAGILLFRRSSASRRERESG